MIFYFCVSIILTFSVEATHFVLFHILETLGKWKWELFLFICTSPCQPDCSLAASPSQVSPYPNPLSHRSLTLPTTFLFTYLYCSAVFVSFSFFLSLPVIYCTSVVKVIHICYQWYINLHLFSVQWQFSTLFLLWQFYKSHQC